MLIVLAWHEINRQIGKSIYRQIGESVSFSPVVIFQKVMSFSPFRSSVRYHSEFDPLDHWSELDTDSLMDPHKEHYSTEIRGLLPYAEYTVQTRLLSAKVKQNNIHRVIVITITE